MQCLSTQPMLKATRVPAGEVSGPRVAGFLAEATRRDKSPGGELASRAVSRIRTKARRVPWLPHSSAVHCWV